MIQCPYCEEYTDISPVFVDMGGSSSGQRFCTHCDRKFRFSYITLGQAFTMETDQQEQWAFDDKLQAIIDAEFPVEEAQ